VAECCGGMVCAKSIGEFYVSPCENDVMRAVWRDPVKPEICACESEEDGGPCPLHADEARES